MNYLSTVGLDFKNTISETNVFRWMLFFLIFLWLVFDPTMATVYTLMILADYVFFSTDDYVSLQFERTKENRISSTLMAIVAYAGFLVISTAVFAVLAPASLSKFAGQGVQGIIALQAASVPILAGNKFLTIVGWSFAIPLIETRFFFLRIYEGLAEYAKDFTGKKIDFIKFSESTIILILVVSAFFVLFHLSSKYGASIPLFITFIFAIISMILIIIMKDGFAAVIFHVLSNLIATLTALNLFAIFGAKTLAGAG